MSWIERILPSIKSNERKNIPEGLWEKCPSCNTTLYRADLELHHFVCPSCDHHIRIDARTRINLLLDEKDRTEIAPELKSVDPLEFKDSMKYKDRYTKAQKNTGENDALIAMSGYLNNIPLNLCVFEFKFMGGSMGSVVGEKFIRAVNLSLKNKVPLVCISSSGGARMQEGLFSLMQMTKTSLGVKLLSDNSIPFISILADPTTGGVSASFATLGDIILAEPNALIGFAGARVVKQTVREDLPEGFQRSEFLLEKGAIDLIVHRKKMKQTLGQILSMLTKN